MFNMMAQSLVLGSLLWTRWWPGGNAQPVSGWVSKLWWLSNWKTHILYQKDHVFFKQEHHRTKWWVFKSCLSVWRRVRVILFSTVRATHWTQQLLNWDSRHCEWIALFCAIKWNKDPNWSHRRRGQFRWVGFPDFELWHAIPSPRVKPTHCDVLMFYQIWYIIRNILFGISLGAFSEILSGIHAAVVFGISSGILAGIF